ncbi:response regulator [Paenibacillus sp. GCM10027626]|uniref:response regulator n=1 Tax=Paenibacillus sp. GCM10027626 TaxID=3273411 RepID=UPI00363C61B9
MNILLVDDEETILSGLAALLRELSPSNFDIYHALNAEQALEILSSQPVNLVISDIHMPGLDGLALTEMIQHRHPELPVVLLTGYNDRHYMQKAIRLKAEDYLFKPVKSSELLAMLNRQQERSKRVRDRQRFMTGEQFAALPYPVKRVMACDLDAANEARQRQLGDQEMVLWMYRKVVFEVAEAFEQLYFITPSERLSPFNLLIGVSADTAELAEAAIFKLAAAIDQFWSENVKLQASFGFSASSAAEWDRLEKEACTTLFYRLQAGSGHFRLLEAAAIPIWEQQHIEQLRSAIAVSKTEEVLQGCMERLVFLFAHCPAAGLAPAIEDLLQTLYTQLALAYPAASRSLPARLVSTSRKLLWAQTSSQLQTLLLNEINEWLQAVIPGHTEFGLIALAKDYITAHFADPLNLKEVAEAIYISPSHLSRLFRKHTKMTFLEFLTHIRVEEVKKQLADPKTKLYDISPLVGYSDWKHLSRIFKEKTGYTPSEYRERLMVSRNLP